MVKKNTSIIKPTDHCRICGSEDLEPVISLGKQYIASIFVGNDIPAIIEQPYPLELVRCSGKNACGLVQLKHSINPNVMYNDYGYRSGTNELMRENLRGIVRKIESIVTLKAGDIVLDIGCNDGTLLESFKEEELVRVGIDPAENVIQAAIQKGFLGITDYFSHAAFARVFPDKKARVVTSIAMFYDLEDPSSFIKDVSDIMTDDGLWVIELSYLPTMLAKRAFDTICHEHLEYYGLRQIEWMLERNGLRVHEVEFNDVNGGSFRLFIRKEIFGPPSSQQEKALQQLRQKETDLGLMSEQPYKKFREETENIRQEISDLLRKIKRDGKSVHVYGASTKGNTILQYCGIDSRIISYAADRNPEKWGRHTLGTNIPIISEEESRKMKPDYYLVLPWHFFSNFIHREEKFLKEGGRFILPLPEVQVVGIEML